MLSLTPRLSDLTTPSVFPLNPSAADFPKATFSSINFLNWWASKASGDGFLFIRKAIFFIRLSAGATPSICEPSNIGFP